MDPQSTPFGADKHEVSADGVLLMNYRLEACATLLEWRVLSLKRGLSVGKSRALLVNVRDAEQDLFAESRRDQL